MKTLIVGAGALGGIILLAAGASVYRGHFRETVCIEETTLLPSKAYRIGR
jgi:hypothetical protein